MISPKTPDGRYAPQVRMKDIARVQPQTDLSKLWKGGVTRVKVTRVKKSPHGEAISRNKSVVNMVE